VSKTAAFSSAREFQVWLFTVSHGQLLLRSVKTDQDPMRIDVLFKDVAYLALPAVLDRIQIDVVELRSLPEFATRGAHAQTAYRITNGQGHCGYVVAGGLFSHFDDKEYYDPSHFSVP
jgi:hypothetical protein